MKVSNGLIWLGLLTLLIIIAAIAVVIIPAPAKAPTHPPGTASTTQASLDDLIAVSSPLPQAQISSPTTVAGQARGSFYFEAVFPVELKDAGGSVIAQGQAQAQSDWTTSDYVPFVATLTFTSPGAGQAGTLVLKNDNPSGDPSKQKELDIPVLFQ